MCILCVVLRNHAYAYRIIIVIMTILISIINIIIIIMTQPSLLSPFSFPQVSSSLVCIREFGVSFEWSIKCCFEGFAGFAFCAVLTWKLDLTSVCMRMLISSICVSVYVCIWVSLCALNWTQTYGTLIMEMDLILTRKYWISQYFAYLLRSQNDIRIIGYYLTSHYNSNHSTNSKNIPTFQECSIVITKSNL